MFGSFGLYTFLILVLSCFELYIMDDIFHPILIDEDNENDDDLDDLVMRHILHDEELLGNRAALYGNFDLAFYNETLSLAMFRFSKADIPRLARVLRIPNPIIVNRVTLTATTALCILLRRLAYPNRLIDLEHIFGYSYPVLSQVAWEVSNIIDTNFIPKLQNLANNNFFDQNKLNEYAQAINAKGCPLQNCWAFIDGTARAICRPSENQEAYYSGHKKIHCLKYQSVCTPDGLIINLQGAYQGRRHDAAVLRESGLLDQLQQYTVFPGQEFVLYGDEGYGHMNLLIRPYSRHEIDQNPQRQIFNNVMRTMRITVEWGFGKVIQIFAFLDYKKNQKLLLQDISSMYTVAVLLTNCHTCLYGSNTGNYFNVNPPALEIYLAQH